MACVSPRTSCTIAVGGDPSVPDPAARPSLVFTWADSATKSTVRRESTTRRSSCEKPRIAPKRRSWFWRRRRLGGPTPPRLFRSRHRACITTGVREGSRTAREIRRRTACTATITPGNPPTRSGCTCPGPTPGRTCSTAPKASGYSHLMRAERFALVWLEQSGYQYDMIDDLGCAPSSRTARRVLGAPDQRP